jgi:hypothetical protein
MADNGQCIQCGEALVVSFTFVRQHVTDPVNQDVKAYLNYVCTSEGLEKPTGWKCALNLCTILKQIAEQV